MSLGSRADFEDVHFTFCADTEATLRTQRGSRLDVVALDKNGGVPSRLRLTFAAGGAVQLSRVVAWQPDPSALEALQGEYVSDEADARLTACVRSGKLVLVQGPERIIELDPSYLDTFTASNPRWLISFKRTAGYVRGLDIGAGRMETAAGARRRGRLPGVDVTVARAWRVFRHPEQPFNELRVHEQSPS